MMAVRTSIWLQISCAAAETLKEEVFSVHAGNSSHCSFPATPGRSVRLNWLGRSTVKPEEQVSVSRAVHQAEFDGSGSGSDDDANSFTMSKERRLELRRKIKEMIANSPDVEEELDPEERRKKTQKLLSEYPLVVDEEDPDWPEDADGRGFNLDQFFDKITIKNVKKDTTNENSSDSDDEIVWKDDNYIKPIKDITIDDWEDTVFRDFNPLVILIHNRYSRPRENDKAHVELDGAVQMFWKTGLPSPRCVAVDAVVQHDLVEALKVSTYPEIIFTKAGKILHRDKVVRTAEEWSKIMAFFYYKAVRPPCLEKTAGQNPEKIPTLSSTRAEDKEIKQIFG
ncbi:Thioredoxin superfamily protein [Zostera marina]|uniref:Thioredoxin superfamily protein n=1 Tax=Zostera marina TaxID=29655 RepID=A0A0K9NWP2_ZOSMR|nr:Thioredoxin superfamily protein [Zostera marina]